MERWYLLYCKPGQDAKAVENLTRQGFHVFSPTINVGRAKDGHRSNTCFEPLFPRYIFIKVDPEVNSIAPVKSTHGVSNFVMFGGVYATAPDSLIDKIKSQAASLITVNRSVREFSKGDRVNVNGYGFDQVKAIYCCSCGSERAMILMEILGEESRVSVPEKCISKYQ